VVLSGHVAAVHAVATETVEAALSAATLRAQQGDPPSVVASSLGSLGPLIGAAESVFEQLIDKVTPLGRTWNLGDRSVKFA
jgi:hypothetical protein